MAPRDLLAQGGGHAERSAAQAPRVMPLTFLLHCNKKDLKRSGFSL